MICKTYFNNLCRFIPVFCLALIAGFLSSALRAADVRLTVSDLIADAILPILREAAAEQGISLDVRELGSLPALTEMRNEEIDLAILAQPITARPLDDSLSVVPLAYELVYVYVHTRNPINDLSVRQLAGIYGSGEELNITQWQELGVIDSASRSINTGALSDTRSMVMELFRNTSLSGRQFRGTLNQLPSAALEAFVAAEPSRIGLSNRMPTKRNIKVISVSQRQGTPAFRPNAENAYFEDYPLRLPFVIAFPERVRARVLPVVNILLSNEVAAALEAIHKVAAPEGTRQAALSDLKRGL